MSTASINNWCLTSVSQSQSSLIRRSTLLRPSIVARLNSPASPPSLIRNEPVFAAPAPIINPNWVDTYLFNPHDLFHIFPVCLHAFHASFFSPMHGLRKSCPFNASKQTLLFIIIYSKRR